MKFNFEEFKNSVREKGGIWASDSVYFTQFKDGYSASYKPSFPNHSDDDCAISYNWIKDEWRTTSSEQYAKEYNAPTHSVREIKGEQPMARKRLFIDIDGTLARFHDVDKHFIEAMWQEGFYRDLLPFENMVEAVALFTRSHPEVEVYTLSAVLETEPPFAEKEKNEWLDKYLPEIDAKHRIFTKAGHDKSEYIPNLSKNDYLIDDYNRNLREFEVAGANAIKFRNDINHRGEGAYGGEKGPLWRGDMISHHLSPERLCEQMESILGLQQALLKPFTQLAKSRGEEDSFCIVNGIEINLKNYTADEALIKRLLMDESFKADVSLRFEKEFARADDEPAGDEVIDAVVIDEISKRVGSSRRSLAQKISDAQKKAIGNQETTVFSDVPSK